MVSFRPQFRARRAVGLLLAGRVGAQTDPSCDSCGGCWKYDSTGSNYECDLSVSDQYNCFYWGGVWCGAAETCYGCEHCYKVSDSGGVSCDSAATDRTFCKDKGDTWCRMPCYNSASYETCSGCYDLNTGSCSVTDAYQCVSPWVKWCGTNPCDSCSGCYSSIDGTCYGASQMMCITEGSQWCGADEGTCNGCEYCYTLSDTGGASCAASSNFEGSACTHYNTVDGVDSTWCPTLNGDVCGECNYCYRDGFCDISMQDRSECLSWAGMDDGGYGQWCGSTPAPATSTSGGASSDVCANCDYCYHDGYCDSAATTETDCASFFGQWCFSGSSDACLDSTGVSCGACLATSDLTCRWGNMYADSVLCTAGGFGTWCGGDACSSCNYCYRDGFCDSTLTDSASCTSHSSTTGPSGLGKWCGGEVCTNCNHCYHDGYCDSTITTETACVVSWAMGVGQWCGAGADVCSSCSNCYSFDEGRCQTEVVDASNCVGARGGVWCGTNPCDSCSGCYINGGCSTTNYGTKSECVDYWGLWCGAADPTCAGCEYYCYTRRDTGGASCEHAEDGTGSDCSRYNNVEGLESTWCDGGECDSCNACYIHGSCDTSIYSESACSPLFGTWCGAGGTTTPRPTPAPTPATSDAVEGSFTCAGITLADAEAHERLDLHGIRNALCELALFDSFGNAPPLGLALPGLWSWDCRGSPRAPQAILLQLRAFVFVLGPGVWYVPPPAKRAPVPKK